MPARNRWDEKAVSQGLAFEIHWRKGQPRRNIDAGFAKPLALPGLGCRVVRFENPELDAEGIAISVGVQACSQHHKLTHSPAHGQCQFVLGETCANGDEQAHTPPRRMLLGLARYRFGVVPEDPQSQRIGEDSALFKNLMGGAICGCSKRSSAGLVRLHPEILWGAGAWTKHRRKTAPIRVTIIGRGFLMSDENTELVTEGDYERSGVNAVAVGFALLLIGFAAGAIAAALLTPKTGKQMRRHLKRKLDDARDAVGDWSEQAGDLRDKASELAGKAQEWAGAAKDAVGPLTKKFKS